METERETLRCPRCGNTDRNYLSYLQESGAPLPARDPDCRVLCTKPRKHGSPCGREWLLDDGRCS
jgi:hypothetical protein